MKTKKIGNKMAAKPRHMNQSESLDNLRLRRNLFNQPQMSLQVFRELGQFIHQYYGIKMPPIKHTMLQSRLQKRLRVLGMDSFKTYRDYVLSEAGTQEIMFMMDAVTTNKTDFFREPDHFDYLSRCILPRLKRVNSRNPLLIWSAGCSTGEEPYTLAMFLEEHKKKQPEFHYRILATDLSTRVLDIARTAIYSFNKIDPVPIPFRNKYMRRSKDSSQNLVRMAPEVRNHVKFERLNFMEDDFRISRKMHIIFCRNVIIYFDRETQKKLLEKLTRQLAPNGYLFVGHSETLNGFDLPFTSIASNVYQRNY
ncbi:CheR family methyltransferase [bacterium]